MLDVEVMKLTRCSSRTLRGLLGTVEDFVKDTLLCCAVSLLLSTLLLDLLLSGRKSSFQGANARLGCSKRLAVADEVSALDDNESRLALCGSAADLGPLAKGDRAEHSLSQAVSGSALESSRGNLVEGLDALDGCAELVEVHTGANAVSGDFGGGGLGSVSHCGSNGDDEEADDEDEESNHFFVL